MSTRALATGLRGAGVVTVMCVQTAPVSLGFALWGSQGSAMERSR